MPGVLSPPGVGPFNLGRYQPPRNTVLPSPSIIIPVGIDGHVEPAAQGTAVTSQLPTGIIDGDLVLIEVCHGSGGPPGTTITTPAGWALLSNLDDGSTKLPTFWRFFVTGDSAPSFTLGTSRTWVTHSTAFRYVDPVHPFGPLDLSWQQTAEASSTTYTSGTLTPYDTGAMLVVCWGGKIASGGTQTIVTASGWGQTAPINQSTIAAVTNQWAHFQYKPLGAPVATSEVVTIGTAAVGQAIIIALRPFGSATPIGYGATGTALHPGQGPSNVGRFWQPIRATNIIAAAPPGATGAATGEQRSADIAAGVKNAIGAAQSGTRISGQAAGVKGAVAAATGPQRSTGQSAGRKSTTAAGFAQQRPAGLTVGIHKSTGAAVGQQRTNGVAPPPAPVITTPAPRWVEAGGGGGTSLLDDATSGAILLDDATTGTGLLDDSAGGTGLMDDATTGVGMIEDDGGV